MISVIFGVLGVALVGFAVLFVVLATVNGGRRKARRQGLSALAAQRGWTYVAGPDPGVLNRYLGDPFVHSSGVQATDMITGTNHGRQFLAPAA